MKSIQGDIKLIHIPIQNIRNLVCHPSLSHSLFIWSFLFSALLPLHIYTFLNIYTKLSHAHHDFGHHEMADLLAFGAGLFGASDEGVRVREFGQRGAHGHGRRRGLRCRVQLQHLPRTRRLSKHASAEEGRTSLREKGGSKYRILPIKRSGRL